MPLLKTILGNTPKFGENCFLADNCTLIGDVTMGNDCSVWFNAILRGDVNSITIGNQVNIQDGAIVHCTYEKAATTIGNQVSIGHNAIIHGCTIEDRVLVGMGAIVMDHAVLKSNCLIAAGAVVLENTVVESGAIYAGVPAKKVKTLEEHQMKDLIEKTANNYVKYASWFKE